MTKNTTGKQLLQWLICIVVAAAILIIPTSESFTQEIRLFLAIALPIILLIIFSIVSLPLVEGRGMLFTCILILLITTVAHFVMTP